MVELRPRVVSFHYGLPEAALLARLKAAGAIVQGSATTVEEARWLEAHGADAIIAQGLEAGGHRGMFLTRDLSAQVGTLALVPQVVDAVRVPVIAAGAIADARGIVAALALGASAVQIGTAYLLCHEAKISQPFRAALRAAGDQSTVLTNVFSGRPARSIRNRLISEVGPISSEAPPFPLAAAGTQPLRLAAEARGSADFSPLLAGQAAALARETGASALTLALANEARCLWQGSQVRAEPHPGAGAAGARLAAPIPARLRNPRLGAPLRLCTATWRRVQTNRSMRSRRRQQRCAWSHAACARPRIDL